MDELMDQFAIEARELVQQASDDLLALERAPTDRGRLESAFRAIHTLKGSVGLFDLGPMHEVLHQAEELLTEARNTTIDIDAGFIDPLIAVVEWVDQCLDDIAREGKPSENLARQSKQILASLHAGETADDTPLAEIPPETVPDWAEAIAKAAGIDRGMSGAFVAVRYEPHPECFFSGDDPLATLAKMPDILHLQIAPKEPWPHRDNYDPFRCNLVIEALTAAAITDVEAVFRLIPDQIRIVGLTPLKQEKAELGAAPEPVQPHAQKMTTMRVEATRVDALLEIAGELVTAKNGLLPLAEDALVATSDERLSRRILSSHQEIERLVGALYSAVTRARMVPLDQTFRRFPRLVRETAARLGKSVDLIVEGEDVEADREIVEEIFEPLLHLVRNALDHGIEEEPDRTTSGKPPRGSLTLRARQRGERIEVELRDDGRGIEPDRIRSAAIAKGILSETVAATLSDATTLQLLFSPGFSTASTVSDLSGRGVGLDAVQMAAQRLGGHVELASTPSVGTVFTLSLPISFSMSRIMVVSVGEERYGVPIEGVIETIRLSQQNVTAVRAGEAFVLRDLTIPLLHLAELLQLKRRETLGTDLRVLIAQAGGERVGIVVDAIAERAETLLRPLSGLLRGLPGIAGTTVLGDGKVLLVLDLEELIG
ncbi:MAG: chemotaxis protein CheA [Rhizobiaceae bacterium]|nr:chemotaxis protein CheA [Rhizobiaceae bacterium]